MGDHWVVVQRPRASRCGVRGTFFVAVFTLFAHIGCRVSEEEAGKKHIWRVLTIFP